MIRRCPDCGGTLVAVTPRAPPEEPEFDEGLTPFVGEEVAEPEGPRAEERDFTHSATELVCNDCGAVVAWVEKDASYEVPPSH